MTEKPAEQAARLRRELQKAEEQVRRCPHKFGKPRPASRDKQEEYATGQYEKQGVHLWPITRWRTIPQNGWERTCEKCGFTEFTTKSKPIVTGYEANFEKTS